MRAGFAAHARYLRLGLSHARYRAVVARSGEDRVWYQAGLRFECTGCGHCCTGADGIVWTTEADIERLAAALALDLDTFGRRHLRRVGDRYALLDSGHDGACVFLEGDRCRVYAARPSQCRRYPFWPSHLASAEAWAKAATACEGIRDDARLLNRDEIESARRD